MLRSIVRRPSGMAGFVIICLGQIVSVLASGMTSFALTIHVFQETGSATALGLMSTSFLVPFLIFSPIAGAMVDRYSRKLMMMMSDLTAGLATLAILLIYATGTLEIWNFYIVNIFLGLGNAFQWPAYSAAISTLVPKEQYGRANGLLSLVGSGPNIVAPLLAGALLPFIGLAGIFVIDLLTFVMAIVALLLVHVPQPPRTVEGQAGQGSLLQEAAYGFQYIFQRRSLLCLQIILFMSNVFIAFPNALLAPVVLSRTGNDSLIFGTVQSAGAIAAVAGGLIMSAWAGFRRRINGMMLGWGLYFLFAGVLMGLGRGLAVWIPAIALSRVAAVLGGTSGNALWQTKVAPDVQGRVFSARRLIAWIPDPIMPLVAGSLADYVTEPAMQAGGGMANTFGWLFGTSPGAGMGLLMVLGGLGGILMLSIGYAIPAVRYVEDILPDHDELERAEQETDGGGLDTIEGAQDSTEMVGEPGLALASPVKGGE
jgi:DHA3 family macrolide efflux protein-like MFS transporter